jgi:hypothetical protein
MYVTDVCRLGHSHADFMEIFLTYAHLHAAARKLYYLKKNYVVLG